MPCLFSRPGSRKSTNTVGGLEDLFVVVTLLLYLTIAAMAQKRAPFSCQFGTVTTDSKWPMSVPDGTVYLLWCLEEGGAFPCRTISLRFSFDVNLFTDVFVYLR